MWKYINNTITFIFAPPDPHAIIIQAGTWSTFIPTQKLHANIYLLVLIAGMQNQRPDGRWWNPPDLLTDFSNLLIMVPIKLIVSRELCYKHASIVAVCPDLHGRTFVPNQWLDQSWTSHHEFIHSKNSPVCFWSLFLLNTLNIIQRLYIRQCWRY